MAIYYNGHLQSTKGGGGSSSGGVDYSTTEQNTGLKWIDGKPIYQKTYYITESTEKEESDYDISNDNVDTIVECGGIVKSGAWGGSKVFTAPRIGDSTYFISVSASSTAFTIKSKTYKYTEGCITIKYTKTTDTV